MIRIAPRGMREIREAGARVDAVRTDVMIPREHNRRLREEALRLGTSVGEIIRCLVALYIESMDGEAQEGRKFGPQ